MQRKRFNGWRVAFLATLMATAAAQNAEAGTGGGTVEISKKAVFTETGVGNGKGTYFEPEGEFECRIGTFGGQVGQFDGATAKLETEISFPKTGAPAITVDVEAPGLLGVIVDSGWVAIRLGGGRYRLDVTGGSGSESLNIHCRRVLGK